MKRLGFEEMQQFITDVKSNIEMHLICTHDSQMISVIVIDWFDGQFRSVFRGI